MIHLSVAHFDSLQQLFLVACEREGDTGTKVVKKTSVLTQVAIGFTVLVTLIILIVILIITYKKQKGKYEVEKRLNEQTNPSVHTTTIAVTPNCSSVNWTSFNWSKQSILTVPPSSSTINLTSLVTPNKIIKIHV